MERGDGEKFCLLNSFVSPFEIQTRMNMKKGENEITVFC